MSDKRHFGFARFLSIDLHDKLKDVGCSTDEYASNACDWLRARGHGDLADRINSEIEEAEQESRMYHARKRAFAALEKSGAYQSFDEIPDSIAANYIR